MASRIALLCLTEREIILVNLSPVYHPLSGRTEKCFTIVNLGKIRGITDGKIKFCEVNQTQPLTLGFLEKCLSEVIANQSQVKQIVDYIKSKRETKIVPEIKRYYN